MNLGFKDRLDAYLQEIDCCTMCTIDPGFNTAVAFWSSAHLINPTTQMFVAPNSANPLEKVYALWEDIDKMIQKSNIQLVVIEGTQMYQDSLKSLTSAAKGDLLRLTGLLYGYLRIAQQHGVEAYILPPIQWKGQMSKIATEKRVKRELSEFGCELANDHLYDAVGMGLSLINQWRVNK